MNQKLNDAAVHAVTASGFLTEASAVLGGLLPDLDAVDSKLLIL